VISTAEDVFFPIYLRIPGWCERPELKINGRKKKISARPDSYILIDRSWADGDKVMLRLPMDIKIKTWAKNHDSVSVSRGPLTYSLKIGEKYVRHGGTDKWPAWEIHPTSDWNYGLLLAAEDAAAQFEVINRPWPEDDQPFKAEAAPVEMRVKARKISAWQLDHLGLVGKIQPSPAKTDEPVETVTLIPMGCARLRISAFPSVLADGTGHKWHLPARE